MTAEDASTYYDQARVYMGRQQWDDAESALKKALSAKPRYPVAYFSLGQVQLAKGDRRGAVSSFETAVAQLPGYVSAHYELANVYRDVFRFGDALREISQVINEKPDFALAYSALGIILLETGQLDKALGAFSAAIRKGSNGTNAPGNWVNTQQYMPGVTEKRLADSNAAVAALFPVSAESVAFSNSPTMDRPLKVGFVSSDFAKHPVGRLTVGLFESLDRSAIDPVIFSTRPKMYEDEISERISKVANWHRVFALPDEDLINRIKSLEVDVLIDLAGHTANNRLGVFARRAAPIQVGWLGYPGSTGLQNMDYLLANDELVPGEAEAYYTEKILRLPYWHACLDPKFEAPPVGPLPAAQNSFITYGCFNNPTKLNNEVVESFARILSRVPGSRMKLQYKTLQDKDLQSYVRAMFERNHISPERLCIVGYVEGSKFFESYNDVDIALDTFPYSGCMTSCDATWMGCPVVTLRGDTFAGRQAASYLSASGTGGLVGSDRNHYEELAVDLAKDMSALAELRSSLRDQISASPTADTVGFAQHFAMAMRGVWSAWCQQQD